ncbi:MAG: hypothetical protein U5L74_10870, partial [Ideonella sp.]|nr:hypothetical protein [Ideonella sp.]
VLRSSCVLLHVVALAFCGLLGLHWLEDAFANPSTRSASASGKPAPPAAPSLPWVLLNGEGVAALA